MVECSTSPGNAFWTPCWQQPTTHMKCRISYPAMRVITPFSDISRSLFPTEATPPAENKNLCSPYRRISPRIHARSDLRLPYHSVCNSLSSAVFGIHSAKELCLGFRDSLQILRTLLYVEFLDMFKVEIPCGKRKIASNTYSGNPNVVLGNRLPFYFQLSAYICINF